MSTRAIAPVVGVQQPAVVKDLAKARQVIPVESPETEATSLTDEPGQVIKLTGSNSVASPGEDSLSTTEDIGPTG
ncbi:hypothetical protein [Glutamicibacter sp.]|uniref:hypothetical protein n=1 Tax=Glutamicibacter sp. TaxID=1931995 RepID=UPI002FE004F5